MTNTLASMPGQFLSLLLVVWVLSAAASGNFYDTYNTYNTRSYGNRHLPSKYGGGRSMFDDFLKCDASVDYCYEYRNESCVGPPNWICLHNLNKAAGRDVTVGGIQDLGFGNTRCCGGKNQSPIDIPADAQCNAELRGMTPFFPNQSQVLTGTFENNGYDSKFFVENEKYDTPLIARNFPFADLVHSNNEYVFANVHFHSGLKEHGSEHFVRGKAYNGEMHMVHVHRDFYSESSGIDLQCASQNPLGLAVIAVFLSLTEGEQNDELNKLLSDSNLEAIREYESECDFDEICDPDSDKFDDKNDDTGGFFGFFGLSRLFKFLDSDDYCGDDKKSDDKGDNNRRRNYRKTERGGEGVKKQEQAGSYNTNYDSDYKKSDGNSKKVKCFCRRHRFEEIVARLLGAGQGAKCRTEMDEEDAEDAGYNNKCSKHMNIAGCSEAGTLEGVEVRPALLLPESREFYHYFGSLTSPPCSEVVNWVVMKEPIRITEKQLDNLHKLESRREDVPIGKFGNTRPLQDINGRPVLSTC